MYSLTIKIPVYKITIHVKIAPEIDKIINSLAKRKKWQEVELKQGEEVHGYAVAANDCINYYIFYDVLSVTSNYLTHEISHVVDYILDERSMENEAEARAYLTGHISEKIFDFVLKKNLLISKYLPKKEVKPINEIEDEKSSGLL